MIAKLLLLALLAAAAPAGPAAAQLPDHPSPVRPQPADTLPVFELETIVVTAERGQTFLSESAAAVSSITAEDLARGAQTTVAEALRRLPGFAVVDFEGGGGAPQLMVRGFYGGGEAEYLVVLVDGVPMNGVESGLVRWDAIPLVAIDRIEVVRGGASALYGDAAVGGVVHIITRAGAKRSDTAWQVAGGTEGTVRAGGYGGGTLFGRTIGVFGGVDRSDGFREEAERTSARAGFRYGLVEGEEQSLTLSAHTRWHDGREPGPLSGPEMAADPTLSHPFYRFDRASERALRVSADGERRMGDRSRVSGSLSGESLSREALRTIALAPDFADSKERVLETRRALGAAQLALDDAARPGDRLILGFEASFGRLDSEYFNILSGPPPAYVSATGERGPLDARGGGHRAAAALYAQYSLAVVDAVRLTVGARGDWLRDRFDPEAPEGEEGYRTSHMAVSPRVGLNVRWWESARQSGRLYLTTGRSFKAPTLDQLFDQRSIPVPFPPFALSVSNALLVPQRGVNLEAGLYHSFILSTGGIAADLSLSAYRMAMVDELDFDLETMRYVNLGESLHRGLEVGAEVRGRAGTTAFLNYTLQHATERRGEYDGKYLKAIPRGMMGGGASGTALAGIEAGLSFEHARGIFLDDANTLAHPDWTRIDARLARSLAGVRLAFTVRNVLDARYSTTGFPDPGGTEVVYFYPAAGRTFELELRR